MCDFVFVVLFCVLDSLENEMHLKGHSINKLYEGTKSSEKGFDIDRPILNFAKRNVFFANVVLFKSEENRLYLSIYLSI